MPNAFNLPAIIHNGTGAPRSYYGATHPPGMMNLYPGASGERSVLRWRSPGAGTIKIDGRFEGLDATTTDVTVMHNSTELIFGANVSGFGSSAPFALTRTVAAGDTIEFRVGDGNGDVQRDHTGLAVTITLR